ncbi:MAG: variant-type mycofactocin precursor [Eubacteriales bacterium]
MEQQTNAESEISFEGPMIEEDIVIETLAIDGICGVY